MDAKEQIEQNEQTEQLEQLQDEQLEHNEDRSERSGIKKYGLYRALFKLISIICRLVIIYEIADLVELALVAYADRHSAATHAAIILPAIIVAFLFERLYVKVVSAASADDEEDNTKSKDDNAKEEKNQYIMLLVDIIMSIISAVVMVITLKSFSAGKIGILDALLIILFVCEFLPSIKKLKSDSYKELITDNENSEEKQAKTHKLAIVIAVIFGVIGFVANIFVPVLAAGDLDAKNFTDVFYYLLIGIAVVGGIFGSDITHRFILCKPSILSSAIIAIIISGIATVFMIQRSVIAGLVALLGYYLIVVMIPFLKSRKNKNALTKDAISCIPLANLIKWLIIMAVLLIVVWQVGYGKIYPIDCLIVLTLTMNSFGPVIELSDLIYNNTFMPVTEETDQLIEEDID